MRVGYSGGVARKGISRGCHIMAAKQVAFHGLYVQSFDVIIICGIQFRSAAQYGHLASRQPAFAVSGSILGETGVGKPVAAHKIVVVIVILHQNRLSAGGGVFINTFPLFSQPA